MEVNRVDFNYNYENYNYQNQYVATQVNAVDCDNENTMSSSGEERKGEQNGYDKKELDKALDKLNKFLEDEKTHAEYSVHEDLGTIMIKIMDEKNDKVLLEVPPKKILDMVASLCKAVGLFDEKA